MGILESLRFKKEIPGREHLRLLEEAGSLALLQQASEDLNGRIHTDSSRQFAYQELSWARQHSTDKAKKIRVFAALGAVKVYVSRSVIDDFLNLDAVYEGSKPFQKLTLKEQIEQATRLAEPILKVETSNSPTALVE